MIWNIFRALVASALVFSTQGYGAPGAKPCEIGEKDPGEVSDENFTVKVADQSDVLVLSVFQSSRTQWVTAGQSLNDENADFYEAMQKVSQVYSKGLNISNVSSNVLYLVDRLMTSSLDFVILDLPYESVRELERLAHSLYTEDMVYQIRYKRGRDETMTRLIQLIVGAPIFVKTYNPQLFDKVQMISGPSFANSRQANAAVLPLSQAAAQPTPVSTNSSEVQKKRDELRDEFRANARTRQEFERFLSMIQSGRFDKDSDAQVREKVLARFWSPAKPKIRAWLDVEMAARRGASSTVSAEPQVIRVRNRPETVLEKYSIAPTVLSAKGRGIVFVPRERFAAVKAEIKKACAQ